MSVLIIGSEGSQGKRYQAILKSLDIPFSCIDLREGLDSWGVEKALIAIEKSSRFIIACPTDFHEEWIRHLLPFGRPILCEKPICKDLGTLAKLLADVKASKSRLTMVYQYRHLLDNDYSLPGDSYYNYFRHGNDGLIWDCLQIIGLSELEPELKEDSPVWQCAINGQPLSIAEMDEAYVDEVIDWMNRIVPTVSLSEIFHIHKKVDALWQKRLL